ncbi:ATP-dependent DNA helicase RecG [Paenibacillus turpanensis]|uniref:ATP-dependent DNA helicase RecG n=1 Tax=Paenibacillus turpanensis TaxID=2689078 RepID=UPI00140B3847|nr:ATP-dependent DNA helicase RecG [Paenibacillus turpanensis]
MLDLHTLPLTSVTGVGPQKAKELAALGITSVADLLFYFPFRYEDYRIRDLAETADGEKVTLLAKVVGMPVLQHFGRRKSRITCKMTADSLMITAAWFNQPFLRERLVPGLELTITGKWDARRRQMTVSETEFPGSRKAQGGTVQPVYSVGGPITQKWIRKVIGQALTQYAPAIPEMVPAEIAAQRGMIPRREAVIEIHQPSGTKQGALARECLVYEELFMFQLKLQAYRAVSRNRKDGVAMKFDMEEVRRFVRELPFTLTASQKQVIAEILRDLQAPSSMNRLLQGDVGSGKTVVAAVSLYAAVRAGHQGALMVPTEILAEQHARSLTRMFEPYGITVGLLTGSLTDKRRRDMIASMRMGLIDVVVGTHALIQEDVEYRSLGLVVTDEQHRFGVQQRSVLRHKGFNPDVLTMTATPIPRTLAITAFGDMDVSTLRELPGGRKPIETYWVKHDKMERVIGFIQRELGEGRQAYVICPLIEESEKLDVQNAIDVHQQLCAVLPPEKVGLLHGRMPAAEKDDVMRRYAAGELGLLVSTTVIEVGVDVPNATLMIIYDADRFGLSQLHQLRGRVGRGSHQSYCILIADPKSETGRERMKAMTETNDGFEISRRDLELRGPGDFFGTKQSGLPEFRLADMVADFETLEQARDDAAQLLAQDDFWVRPEYAALVRYLKQEGILGTGILD